MKQDIHIETIYPDEEFWLQNVDRVKHFFNTSKKFFLNSWGNSTLVHPNQLNIFVDVQQTCSSGTSSSSLLETIDTTMDASNKIPT